MLLITPRQNNIYWNEEATFAVAAAPKVQSAIAAQWQKCVRYCWYEETINILNMTENKYIGSALLPSPKLVINDAEIEDSGKYRLRVRIREGWCDSDWVYLGVSGSK